MSAVLGGGEGVCLEDAPFSGAAQLVLISVPETVEGVVDRARRAGIEHIVVVSSAAVTAGYDTTYNLPVERAARDSGLDATIVRPGEFATNALLTWGPSIRDHRRVVEPFRDQRSNPIHEADIADVIVANLLDPQRRGRIDTIVGPDALTKREQVAAIAAAIGDDIALDEVTPEEARAFYRAQGGFAAANADFLFGFESYDGVEGATDEPHDTSVGLDETYLTLTQITGRPGVVTEATQMIERGLKAVQLGPPVGPVLSVLLVARTDVHGPCWGVPRTLGASSLA